MAYFFNIDVESSGLIIRKCDKFVDFQKLSLGKKCHAIMEASRLAG